MGWFWPEPSLNASFTKPAHLARDSGGVMDVAGIKGGVALDTS